MFSLLLLSIFYIILSGINTLYTICTCYQNIYKKHKRKNYSWIFQNSFVNNIFILWLTIGNGSTGSHTGYSRCKAKYQNRLQTARQIDINRILQMQNIMTDSQTTRHTGYSRCKAKYQNRLQTARQIDINRIQWMQSVKTYSRLNQTYRIQQIQNIKT